MTQIYTFIRPLCLACGEWVKGTQRWTQMKEKRGCYWSQGESSDNCTLGMGRRETQGLKVDRMCQLKGSWEQRLSQISGMRNSTLVTSIKERNPVRIWRDCEFHVRYVD